MDTTQQPWSVAKAVGLGTLAVAVLDALDAIVFFGLRGTAPARIFQGIASGLLGRASFQGGVVTVLLGVAIHFFVAFGIVSTYFAASRRVAFLRERPGMSGVLYGLVAFFVMNRVVIPVSAIGYVPFSLAPFVNGVLVHCLGIGPISALVATKATADAGRGLADPRPGMPGVRDHER